MKNFIEDVVTWLLAFGAMLIGCLTILLMVAGYLAAIALPVVLLIFIISLIK